MPHALSRLFAGFALLIALLAPPQSTRADADAARDEHRAFIESAVPVLTTAHFRFFGEEAVHGTLRRIAAEAESKLSWMCTQLDNCDRIEPPIDVWIAEDALAFAKAFPGKTPMSEWAAGVAFLHEQRIVLRAHGTAVFSVRETFEHELAHVLTHIFSAESGERWPRWFSEGLAIWLSGESTVQRLHEALRAAASGALLPPETLTRAFPLEGARVSTAYAQSALAMRWVARRIGPTEVVRLLQDIADGKDFDGAFTARVGVSPEEAIALGTERIETGTSFFYHFWDGNLIWALMAVLFIVVAVIHLRRRRKRLGGLDEAEASRIATEDALLLSAWERERALRRASAARGEPPEGGAPVAFTDP